MGKRDKGGQNMTLGTIILIVLGLVVLVFLIYGFSVGWDNLFGKLKNFGGTKSNVDTIKQACILACQQGKGSYEFKSLKRTIIIENGTKYVGTCGNFSEGKYLIEKGQKSQADLPPEIKEQFNGIC